jgi:hypothetical protein
MRRVEMISGRPLREHGDPTMLAVLSMAMFTRARFALVKMGGGVIGMSGSIAGNTFARNRSGNYVRARTKPVNPNTQPQQDIRTALSYLTSHWSTQLSSAQRTGWATYAAAIAMKNRLGESIYLTGFNHFVRSNTEWLNRGHITTIAPPTTLLLPSKDTIFAISASVATQKVSVVFNNGATWAIAVGGVMFTYMGVPRNVTRNFFNGPWKFMAEIAGAIVPPTSPAVLDPPMILVLGQLITVYARIREIDGRISEPFTASCVVAA